MNLHKNKSKSQIKTQKESRLNHNAKPSLTITHCVSVNVELPRSNSSFTCLVFVGISQVSLCHDPQCCTHAHILINRYCWRTNTNQSDLSVCLVVKCKPNTFGHIFAKSVDTSDDWLKYLHQHLRDDSYLLKMFKKKKLNNIFSRIYFLEIIMEDLHIRDIKYKFYFD